MMNIFNQLISEGVLFDSHCHLNVPIYDIDRAEVLKRMLASGVEAVFDIGTDLKSSEKAIGMQDIAVLRHDIVSRQIKYASVGMDMEAYIPGSDLYVENYEDVLNQFMQIENMCRNDSMQCANTIQMIGETGIDLYWPKKREMLQNDIALVFERQKELFRKHIELANDLALPLSIHSRDAIDECLNLLGEITPPDLPLNKGRRGEVRGVFHSLTPDFDDDEGSFYSKIKQIHEMGFHIGLNGIITFKSAKLLREKVIKIIRENLNMKRTNACPPTVKDIYDAGFVFETDGPFLSPEGKRGQRNEPGNVKDIWEFLKESLSNI